MRGSHSPRPAQPHHGRESGAAAAECRCCWSTLVAVLESLVGFRSGLCPYPQDAYFTQIVAYPVDQPPTVKADLVKAHLAHRLGLSRTRVVSQLFNCPAKALTVETGRVTQSTLGFIAVAKQVTHLAPLAPHSPPNPRRDRRWVQG